MIQPKFDLELSRTESTPEYPEGVIFVKRIVVKRNTIDWSEKYQVRDGIYIVPNQVKIRKSYEENGFLYSEGVQVVTKSVTSDKEFEGVAGFNRNSAQDDLSWDTTIVDVVEFESELRRIEYGYESNHDFAPKAGNTEGDIFHGINETINAGHLDRTDDVAIKRFIDKIAADFSKGERDTFFKKFRKQVSQYSNMVPMDSAKANKTCKEMGLQYGGDKNPNADGFGYAKDKGGSKTTFHDGMTISTNNNGAVIKIYGYISSPKPSTLSSSRKVWMEQFEAQREFHFVVASKTSGIPISTLRKNGWYPFRFGGFLPQDVTPVGALKAPKESTLIDVDGKSMGGAILRAVV